MSDELPLEDRVERHREAHPEATIPSIAGALGASPTAVADVLDEDVDTGDESADVDETPTPDTDDIRLQGDFSDADFEDPEPGLYPPSMVDREQWMGHQKKKPFAVWGDEDAPAECSRGHCARHDTPVDGCHACERHDDDDTTVTADKCDHDARYKWGYAGHYRDGEQAAMAEVDPRLDGLAYIQLPDDPYVYVDGDDVRDPETGQVHPAFIAVLEHFGLTYADISQSGAGSHAIYRGDLPDGVKQASWQLDDEPWGSNDEIPTIEIYPGKRVCVMTGDHVPGTPTEVREWDSSVIDALLEANDEVATANRDQDHTPVSTDSSDYDLSEYDPEATTSSETTDDIRDIFAALDRLDAQRVAERTIVHSWNDSASTSKGERAFRPTWGPNSNGTANIVNSERWQDTGDQAGYGGVVVMALIDAGEMQPSRASPKRATGELWWTGVEHLRELGFDIPKYDSSDAPTEGATSGGAPDPAVCTPPAVDFHEFDRDQRWDDLQGDRYDQFIQHSGPTIWGDHAGAGKTTNAGRAAAQRGRPFVALFDKHEKAREFVLDDATPEVDFHLKGGEQKKHEHCMDADHADEQCHDHPSGDCPHMCPIYDLDPDEDARQQYEAVVEEIGPVRAHMLLDLPLHDDDGNCAWMDQFDKIESADRVVGVHEYQRLKTVRDGRDVIVDESPSSLITEREVDVEGLARAANALNALGDLGGTPDALDEFASFARDVMDTLTGGDASALSDLSPPDIDAETYLEEVDLDDLPDDVDPSDVEQRTVRENVGMPEEGHVKTTKHVVERSFAAETLAQAKLSYNENIVNRMRNDEWDGAPLCFDALLAAAAQAGLDEDAVRQAIAIPTILENCPWCRSDLEHHNGARHCSDADCDWHEQEHKLTRKHGERARALAWVDDQAAALNYAALPLASDLPDEPLVLDATATPAKVAALYDVHRDCVDVQGDEQLDSNLHTTQVLDGQYHAGTIQQALDEDRALATRIQRTIDTVGDLHQRPLFIGPKNLLDAFEFPEHGETLHYHAARGLNRAECDAVVCIGAPHPQIDDLQRQADLLGQGRTEVRVGGTEYSTRRETEPPVWRQLLFEDDNGDGRAIATKDFSGLVGELWRETREKELVQAVHRIRPLLADQTKHAYLLTNVPTDLPVDELATFEELADPLEAMLPVPEGAVDLLEAVHDVAAGNGPDGFRASQLIEQRDGTIVNKVAGYHRLAQLSGLDVSKRTVYEWVHALEEIGLLEPQEYEQHAGVSYAADFATLKSALSLITNNGGFKVAATRRLRSLLAESGTGLDWLAWARDVFRVRGGPGGDWPTTVDGGGPPN